MQKTTKKNIVSVVVVVAAVDVLVVVVDLLDLVLLSRFTSMQNLEVLAWKLTELWPIWFRSKKGRYRLTDFTVI